MKRRPCKARIWQCNFTLAAVCGIGCGEKVVFVVMSIAPVRRCLDVQKSVQRSLCWCPTQFAATDDLSPCLKITRGHVDRWTVTDSPVRRGCGRRLRCRGAPENHKSRAYENESESESGDKRFSVANPSQLTERASVHSVGLPPPGLEGCARASLKCDQLHLYAVRATERVPAGSCHFSCFTDPSQSVASFLCV